MVEKAPMFVVGDYHYHLVPNVWIKVGKRVVSVEYEFLAALGRTWGVVICTDSRVRSVGVRGLKKKHLWQIIRRAQLQISIDSGEWAEMIIVVENLADPAVHKRE